MAKKPPAKKDSGGQKAAGRLLSTESRDACEQVAAGTSLWSQRARALLAVDEGATQAQAGQTAGLTQGQVKYWVGKFRSDQLGIFPESELALDAPREEKKKDKTKGKSKRQSKKAKKAKTGKKPQKKKKKKKRAANRSRRKSGKKRKS
jgi:transposase-like protein